MLNKELTAKQMEFVLGDDFWEESKTGTTADLSAEEMVEIVKMVEARRREVKLEGYSPSKLG